MRAETALAEVQRLFLDSAPLIYALENHVHYHGPMKALLTQCREQQITLVTSPITLAECLVHPIRHRNDTLVRLYRDIIVSGANTEFVE